MYPCLLGRCSVSGNNLNGRVFAKFNQPDGGVEFKFKAFRVKTILPQIIGVLVFIYIAYNLIHIHPLVSCLFAAVTAIIYRLFFRTCTENITISPDGKISFLNQSLNLSDVTELYSKTVKYAKENQAEVHLYLYTGNERHLLTVGKKDAMTALTEALGQYIK